MSEWLDIVDADDKVVGRATRESAHRNKQQHRSSHVVLFNTSGQVLVQHRSHDKDTNPGLWDSSAAGHVDSGESYLRCAARELEEELGVVLDTADLTPIAKLRPEDRNGFEFTQIYKATSDQSLVLQQSEIIDAKWLLPGQLESWMSERPADFTDIFHIIWPIVWC